MSEENGKQYNDVVETTDEDGNVHYFEKVEEVEVDGVQYALLIYQGGEDDEETATEDEEEGFEEEYVVMKITQDEDGAVYEYIEDEVEFKKVLVELEKLDYDFDLSDDDEEEDEDGDDESDEGEAAGGTHEGHVHGPGCKHD